LSLFCRGAAGGAPPPPPAATAQRRITDRPPASKSSLDDRCRTETAAELRSSDLRPYFCSAEATKLLSVATT
jgi:hypothetical protein